MSTPPRPPYHVEFYASDSGRQPAADFLDGLDAAKKAVLVAATAAVLAHKGKDVCDTEYGKPLGDGLFEFRVRDRGLVTLWLYFHPYGDKIILLLGGCDKGRFGTGRREQKAIRAARRNLEDWKVSKR